MRLGLMIEGLQSLSPKLYDALKILALDLDRFFANFNADTAGISFGEIKWSKEGLLESVHGIFVRKQIESDTPICAIYQQATGTIAGAGPFTWDTMIFESAGYFNRITANTQIQIMKPGKYLIAANLASPGNAAGARVDANFNKNAVNFLTLMGYAGFDGFVPISLVCIQDFIAQQILDVQCTAGRFGAVAGITTLSIHKLN